MSLLGVGRSLGRGLSAAGNNKAVLGGIGLLSAGIGAGSVAAPAARDAAFDFAFGDPNADVAFTGRKMSTRYLMGNAIGGPVGFGMRFSSPQEYGTFSSPIPTGSQAIIGAGVGIGAGAGIGAGIGVVGAKMMKKSPMLGALGLGIGAIAGGIAGGTSGIYATRGMMQDNQRFFQESPYRQRSSSMSTMSGTNAVGDIVLGMHNSRRGY